MYEYNYVYMCAYVCVCVVVYVCVRVCVSVRVCVEHVALRHHFTTRALRHQICQKRPTHATRTSKRDLHKTHTHQTETCNLDISVAIYPTMIACRYYVCWRVMYVCLHVMYVYMYVYVCVCECVCERVCLINL